MVAIFTALDMCVWRLNLMLAAATEFGPHQVANQAVALLIQLQRAQAQALEFVILYYHNRPLEAIDC